MKKMEIIMIYLAIILMHISVFSGRVSSHICVLKTRPDPLMGDVIRWSLPYRQICKCEGVVAHKRYVTFCPEADVDESDHADVTLWFTDDPRQLTLYSNWNADTLDRMLDRVKYCTTSWEYMDEWSTCDVTCGGSTQTRTQSCVNLYNSSADGQCSGKAITESRSCNENPCPTWQYVNEWTLCSATCYDGTQTRTQSCVNSDNTTAEGQCSGNGDSEVQACNVTPCLYGECFTDHLARDYHGVVSSTKTGIECQPWTSQSPHDHSVMDAPSAESGLGDHNYCRNPDGSSTAWCYTIDADTRWDYCDVGEHKSNCDALPQDCYDILRMYRNISDTYVIYPTSTPAIPITVWCDMETDGGGWTVFQRRQDGSVDFYRNWDEYAAGFGRVEGEFWLGNENIHIISNLQGKSYNLRIDLDDGDETRFAIYDGFYIARSEDYYRLKFTSYMDISNAGDSLTPKGQNQPFSTHDEDHDSSAGNCALAYSGAWWYQYCHWSNLNGLYLYGEEDIPEGKSVVWSSWKGQLFSMKSTEMKIRPAAQ